MLLPALPFSIFFPSVFIFFFLIWPVAVFHHWAEDVGVDHAHADGYEGETGLHVVGIGTIAHNVDYALEGERHYVAVACGDDEQVCHGKAHDRSALRLSSHSATMERMVSSAVNTLFI